MDGLEGGRMDEPGHRPSSDARRRLGHRRLGRLACALFACAAGSVPALAAPDLPPPTVPPLEAVQDEPKVPEGTTPTTQLATSPTTTAPATAPNPATTTPASPSPTVAPTTAPASSNGPDRRGRRTGAGARGARTPEQPPVTTLVDISRALRAEGPAFDRLRDASVPAARQFSFPLGLGALVLGFLAIQGRLDGRDPKLARAPVSTRDDLLPFT